ncbi:MAG: type II toxin-antitoxin system prevent-host-death family antitoxin [Cyanobacteria bacterium P01_G01_bin.54]
MHTITDKALTGQLTDTLNHVCDAHVPVTITREDGRAVVILSLEEYEALAETAYLLRNPKNAQRLMASIAELEAGGGQEQELIE